MAPTLNQDDIKLLKTIFATKEDLNSIKVDVSSIKKDVDSIKLDVDSIKEKMATKLDLKKTEAKLMKRMDYVDKVLDKEHVKLAREVRDIKIHVGLPILN